MFPSSRKKSESLIHLAGKCIQSLAITTLKVSALERAAPHINFGMNGWVETLELK